MEYVFGAFGDKFFDQNHDQIRHDFSKFGDKTAFWKIFHLWMQYHKCIFAVFWVFIRWNCQKSSI